ncbi:MAG: hypothetical protein IPP71_08950 [Bacteroidetes bacterium]|nr:hypothetical protein [Bacteroidota bacterium]
MHYFNEALRLAHQLNETTNTVKTNLLASFELIPNPANENCMVKFNEFNQKFVLQVRQATGQLVFSAELLPHTQSKLLDTSTMDQEFILFCE